MLMLFHKCCVSNFGIYSGKIRSKYLQVSDPLELINTEKSYAITIYTYNGLVVSYRSTPFVISTPLSYSEGFGFEYRS
jgi:hypothetical protein